MRTSAREVISSRNFNVDNRGLESFLFFLHYKKRYVRPYRQVFRSIRKVRGPEEVGYILEIYNEWEKTVLLELINRSVKIAETLKQKVDF